MTSHNYLTTCSYSNFLNEGLNSQFTKSLTPSLRWLFNSILRILSEPFFNNLTNILVLITMGVRRGGAIGGSCPPGKFMSPPPGKKSADAHACHTLTLTLTSFRIKDKKKLLKPFLVNFFASLFQKTVF
jgi:hypothetical protein